MHLQYFLNVEAAQANVYQLERLETLYVRMDDGPEKHCLLRKISDIREVSRPANR